MGALLVGNAGLLIRDLYTEEPDTLGVVLRIATVVCWLVLLVASVIGRYRQHRQTAERGHTSPVDRTQTSSLHHLCGRAGQSTAVSSSGPLKYTAGGGMAHVPRSAEPRGDEHSAA
ncbi:protein of unknown function [Modestobacter italicus]|uniref:Uncharacterized protein n=1 Tax=Modestobacter italicus (strain DSM 44449 / CECT 9708 / BC 501) TaxID=2732864 RepID=I4EQZ3_MODI5|nr:protein of unknown function [Modestobacter marinus]